VSHLLKSNTVKIDKYKWHRKTTKQQMISSYQYLLLYTTNGIRDKLQGQHGQRGSWNYFNLFVCYKNMLVIMCQKIIRMTEVLVSIPEAQIYRTYTSLTSHGIHTVVFSYRLVLFINIKMAWPSTQNTINLELAGMRSMMAHFDISSIRNASLSIVNAKTNNNINH